MKLVIDKNYKNHYTCGMFTIDTSANSDEEITLFMDTTKLYEWYPFNVNFCYKYSISKGFAYLTEEIGNVSENYYHTSDLNNSMLLNVEGASRFDPLKWVHPYVKRRNFYIMDRAVLLGFPTLETWEDETLTLKRKQFQVKKSLRDMGGRIQHLKEIAEEKYMNLHPDPLDIEYRNNVDGRWDKEVYEYLNEKEKITMQEYAEMLGMFHLMRKIVKSERNYELEERGVTL